MTSGAIRVPSALPIHDFWVLHSFLTASSLIRRLEDLFKGRGCNVT